MMASNFTRSTIARDPAHPIFPAAKKGYRSGTHRLVPPETTLARLEPLLADMGITRVANVTGLDKIGIPVAMACRPNSRSVAVSQGKGSTLEAAKASALMETIETYHAEQIELPLRLGNVADLKSKLPLVQYERLPRRTDSVFDNHRPLLWIEGVDLVSHSSRWVPFEMVHLNCYEPLPSGHGCFVANSNGLASGNNLTEAICHGVCELVERDATTIWHHLPFETQQATRIGLESVDDPICGRMISQFKAADVKLGVWDTTSDIGVPSFICRIVEGDGTAGSAYRPTSGMGCHPTREVALARALSEAAQSRLTYISGARDDVPRSEYERLLSEETAELWQMSLALSDEQRPFTDVPTFQGECFEDDLRWMIERLAAVGINEVVAVELTKTEIGIPVVRMIVPGLEGTDQSKHFSAGERLLTKLRAHA